MENRKEDNTSEQKKRDAYVLIGVPVMAVVLVFIKEIVLQLKLPTWFHCVQGCISYFFLKWSSMIIFDKDLQEQKCSVNIVIHNIEMSNNKKH